MNARVGLSRLQVDALLSGVPGWSVDREGLLEREWRFPDLPSALGFLRRLDGLPSKGPAPEVTLRAGRVRVRLGARTGLTRADFLRARRISAL